MLRIHFTPQDVARTRVATSVDPLWEIVLSLHVLQMREPPVAFHQWRAVARENILRRGLAKQKLRGYEGPDSV